MSKQEESSTQASIDQASGSVRSRASRLITPRAVLDEQVARLNGRIDDEIRGLDQRLASSLSDEASSLRDEVGRLDDLIRDLYLRIDTFVAEVGRVDALIEVVELRLAEAVELKGQDRSAERAEARRMAALDARLTELEGRSAQGG